ncbi:YbaK/EbsC family protein [Wukongibacter baidiensis]|uniref:proline--tRNA ligase n=1 Tax=Wukongibacter baidiensis TaxID=1723361 RepID=UPI003D7FFCCC
MLMSKLIGKTSKKVEDEFNIDSQKLLLRSGMFRGISPGLYSVLPLGKRVIDKLLNLLSGELKEQDFQNVIVPSNTEFERAACLTLRNDLKSYKDLPKSIYNISSLEREKIKVKDGALKSKSFTALRSFSFYDNEQNMLDGFKKMKETYKTIFEEIGLSIIELKSYNHKNPVANCEELVVNCEKGDRRIFSCKACGYRALEEMADFHIEENDIEDMEIEPVHTPNIKTIKELEEYMNIEAGDLAKTLLVKAGDETIAIIIRGNRELNLYKLSTLLNVPIEDIKMADYEDIDGKIETVPGFVGPVELEGVRIIVDREITKIGSLVTGANKRDYHLKNVRYERDFLGDMIADVSYIGEDDKCPLCGEELTKENGIDVGKVLSVGRITDVKSMEYKNREGKPNSIYGASTYIDIYRLLSMIVERNHDEDGIIWPTKVAPYQVIVSILNIKKEDQIELGKRLYNELKDNSIEVILDDRNERAGAKFYDADLLGIPVRIVVARGAGENKVEFKLRWENEKEELNVDEALKRVVQLLK